MDHGSPAKQVGDKARQQSQVENNKRGGWQSHPDTRAAWQPHRIGGIERSPPAKQADGRDPLEAAEEAVQQGLMAWSMVLQHPEVGDPKPKPCPGSARTPEEELQQNLVQPREGYQGKMTEELRRASRRAD